MLQVDGRCPRCGHELTYWLDMYVNDDTIMSDVYDWVDKTTEHEGHFVMIGEPKCPECESEILVSIQVTPFITTESAFEPKTYVDWDEEQVLRAKSIVYKTPDATPIVSIPREYRFMYVRQLPNEYFCSIFEALRRVVEEDRMQDGVNSKVCDLEDTFKIVYTVSAYTEKLLGDAQDVSEEMIRHDLRNDEMERQCHE